MNSSEKRRKQLLERTRNLYSDSRFLPAVHPRYRNLYGQLYGYEEKESTGGTLAIRMFVCLLLFAAFVTMDRQDEKILGVIGSERIVHEIETDFQAYGVWENL